MSNKNKKFDVQVNSAHYESDNYNNFERFTSYYHQLKLVKDNCKRNDKILEVGVGDKTLSVLLRNNKYNLKTCDFDEELTPDFVADIRSLSFKDNSFDTILAFEILEHIPFNDFKKALKELHRVSSDKVIFSVPYNTLNIYGSFRMPLISAKYFLIRFMEMWFIKNKFNGEHYWVMGRKGYSRKRIREEIKKKKFRIENESHPNLNPSHYFFVLRKQ